MDRRHYTTTRCHNDARAPVSAQPSLPLRTLLAYGGPAFGLSYLLFFVHFYFLKFSTDVLLQPPAAMGLVLALGKLWHGVNDPLIGSWSDRTRSRLGRRRPFLFAAMPFLLVSFAMLWRPPETLSGVALTAWVTAAMFAFHTAFALYMIPHVALGAELSSDSHERTRLFGAKQMSFTFGMFLVAAAIQVAMNARAPRAATGDLALITGLLAVLVLAWTPLVVREPVRDHLAGGRGLASGFRDVWANAPARILLVVTFIESAGVGAVGAVGPYVAQYVLQRPEVVGTLSALYVLAAFVSIPIWVRLSRRFGRRETWLAAMVLAAAGFGGLWFMGPQDIAPALVLVAVGGAAGGCGSVLSRSILADVIDLDEQRTGERKEGIYSAALFLALKVGVSGTTALSGFVLSASGFVPNAVQSAETLFGLRLLFSGLPCAGFVIGALLFWRAYPRSEKATGLAVAAVANTTP